MAVEQDGVSSRRYRGRSGRSRISGVEIFTAEGRTIIYPTRDACISAIYRKLLGYPGAASNVYDCDFNYTAVYNSWLLSTGYMQETVVQTNMFANTYRESIFKYETTITWQSSQGPVVFFGEAQSPSKREAFNHACWKLFQNIKRSFPVVQGDDTQECVQCHLIRDNTIARESYLDELWSWLQFWKRQCRHNWKPIPKLQGDVQEDAHLHLCKSCGKTYLHYHRKGLKPHTQFDYQCPNSDCLTFHEGHNVTRAELVKDEQLVGVNVPYSDIPKVQGDPTEQGDPTQSSDRQSNTIITEDQGIDPQIPEGPLDRVCDQNFQRIVYSAQFYREH
ncbi:hypothetical protein QAD02_024112 [Eretmocerus hayati]|uniref:Uncharacterized protein n=1 Tax=Eretmocerus hayati TaxID=131215 RepID=A0ACC2Q168_9HYME|nr:hypothetical protein QAD02_024112 [Eretmocerus hayati]